MSVVGNVCAGRSAVEGTVRGMAGADGNGSSKTAGAEGQEWREES